MNFSCFPLKGGLSNIKDLYFDGVHCGMKTNPANSSPSEQINALDLGFVHSKEPMQVSAIFTSNHFQASPIKHFLSYGEDFKSNFLLLNSKNANAMNGKEGLEDIEKIMQYASSKLELICPIMSSTGVIGKRLEIEKITKGIDQFSFTNREANRVAHSIMTTDSFAKQCAYEVKTDKGSFVIAGIAKGAGMINPSMATMLCFLFTDAIIPKADAKKLLREQNEATFNAISVDGDTSTNDTLMLFSTEQNTAYDKEAFSFALKQIMQELAFDILKDGEGASKLVAFEVRGAQDDRQASTIAKKLSNSLLVKTALFGCDPNWGRIASTVGSSGCECDESKLSIFYDDLCVYREGQNIFTSEIEELAFRILKKDSFKIVCDLHIGEGNFTAYGCDLSYEYVKINAEYRT